MKLLTVLITMFFAQIAFSQDISDIQDTASSPNGKLIAFIKLTKKIIPDHCFTTSNSDDQTATDPDTGMTIDSNHDKDINYAKQIWIHDVKSKKERLLVDNNFSCKNPETQMLDPQQLHFSPDGKKLYFITTGWVTSGALHVVNVDGTKEHFLIPANEFSILQKGQYKGYIVAWQHRYFVAGGSYNWYWLFSPSGKEVGPLGKDVTSDQKKYLES